MAVEPVAPIEGQAPGTSPSVTVVDASQTGGRVHVDPGTPEPAPAPTSDQAAPEMPEGGQEKYWDASTGVYDWESAFKEQAWIASQKAPEQAAENTGETPAPDAENAAAEGLGAAANIDFAEFNSDVMQNGGGVSDEMLAQFEAKGIDPAIVLDYAETMYQKAVDHIETVKGYLGGEHQVAVLNQHLQNNYTAEEIAAFENQLTDPGTWRAAASFLLSDAGLAPGAKGVIKGPNAQSTGTTGESFSDEAEFQAAIRRPEYRTDAAYRTRVENALRNSPHLMTQGVSHNL